MGKKRKRRKEDWVMVFQFQEETTTLPALPVDKPEKKHFLKSLIKKLFMIYNLLK